MTSQTQRWSTPTWDASCTRTPRSPHAAELSLRKVPGSASGYLGAGLRATGSSAVSSTSPGSTKEPLVPSAPREVNDGNGVPSSVDLRESCGDRSVSLQSTSLLFFVGPFPSPSLPFNWYASLEQFAPWAYDDAGGLVVRRLGLRSVVWQWWRRILAYLRPRTIYRSLAEFLSTLPWCFKSVAT